MTDAVAVPMLTAGEIVAAAERDVLKGVENQSAGAIYFPDQVLTIAVDTLEGESAAVLAQWSRTHRFVLAPFSVAVRPNGDRIPTQVDVALAFADIGDLSRQPIILDVFPANGFRKAAFEGSASVKIGASGGFEPVAGAGAEGKAEAGFSYAYAPAYADVASGFASGHAFWRFARSQSEYPVGEIPLKALIAVPRALGEDVLTATLDVQARFTGALFRGGAAVASFTTLFRLP